jgi:hypothetical protein
VNYTMTIQSSRVYGESIAATTSSRIASAI